MLFPSCKTDVPPPELLVAVDAHSLRADLHISVKVPEYQHATRLLCYGVTGAHTAAKTERTACFMMAALRHLRFPDVLMQAVRWPVLGFSAPPPNLPIAARCKAFQEFQTPWDGVDLGIDLRKLILQKPSRIPGSSQCFIRTPRASAGMGPCSVPNCS